LLQDLLRKSGHSLEYFHIDIYDPALSLIDLSSCTSLRSLHLDNIPLGLEETLISGIEGVMLNRIESHSIRELLFGFRINSNSDFVHVLQEFDWDGTSKILSRPQFANLERIIIRFPAGPQLKEVKWIIKEEYLPDFKRILRFES